MGSPAVDSGTDKVTASGAGAGRIEAAYSLALVALVALIYLPSLRAPFVFDDIGDVKGLVELPASFFEIVLHSKRPLVAATVLLTGKFTSEPWAFRLGNCFIHATAAIMAFRIAIRIFRCPTMGMPPTFIVHAAALSAAAWAAHPLNTSSVTYITHRYESLAGLFYFVAVAAFLRGIQTERTAPLAVAVASIALGGLAKETLVTAPFALLLLDVLLVSGSVRNALRARRRFYASALLAIGPIFFLFLSLPAAPSQGVGEGVTRLGYFAAELGVVAHYARLVVWPEPLCVDYYDWPVGFAGDLGSWLTIALAVGTAYGLARRARWSLPFALLFLILAPTSTFVPLRHELVAERRMYIPLLALSVGAVAMIVPRAHRLGSLALTVGGLATVLVLAGVSLLQNSLYLSASLLFAHEVEVRPHNARARILLASSLLDEGRLDEATAELRVAMREAPSVDAIEEVAARIAFAKRDYLEAAHWARIAVRRNPTSVRAAHVASMALRRANAIEEAVALLTPMTDLPRASPRLLDDLAWLYATEPGVRNGARAVQLSERAIADVTPRAPSYYRETLAAALAAAGKSREALLEIDALLAGIAHPESAPRLHAMRAEFAAGRMWSRSHEDALEGRADPLQPREGP